MRVSRSSQLAFGGLLSAVLGSILFATAVSADQPATPVSKPMDPAEVVRKATLPKGFEMTVFAAEPDIVQPIAFTIDDRGRLWVVEGLTYPTWITDGKPGRDRVTILEDTDGDGRHDKRTVFLDNGTNLSGIELGFGGVYLCSVPNVLFVPDKNGDDKPDGPAEVLLDGFDLKSRHNVVNGLHWGPDGWLYGLNGILSNSNIGKPGTPDDKRTFMNCGVWRFHPVKKTFEVVAHGTTNPWGMDWDDHGRQYITNCVIEHVFHIIPGGHYKRMFGQDAMPHSYELLQTCADHIHWGGGKWTDSRGGQGIHDEAGGGHAHVGCMVYYGDNWPKEYRGKLYTCNIHGARVNCDRIEAKGSGVELEHDHDFLKIPDPWFRGLELKYGPDGGVYLTDWSDDGECHDYTEQDINRQNGRIYKITYGKPEKVRVNMADNSDEGLLRLHLSPNAWYAQHARRLLQERQARGGDMLGETNQLQQLVANKQNQLSTNYKVQDTLSVRFQMLQTLHALGAFKERSGSIIASLDKEPSLRAAAVAYAFDAGVTRPDFLTELEDLAKSDVSPAVRLALASGLQKIPVDKRWRLAEALLAHSEDVDDHNLPLMLWYGIEPLVAANRDRAFQLLAKSKIPLTRQFVARRAVTLDGGPGGNNLNALIKLLGDVADANIQKDVLQGILQALEGKKAVEPPSAWAAVADKLTTSSDADVHSRATQLAVLFGDPKAMAALTATLKDTKADNGARTVALQTLLPRRDPALVPVLYSLLSDASFRGAAIRGLAAFEEPDLPEKLVAAYAQCTDAEKQDVVATLAMRHKSAEALIAAMEQKRIPVRDVSTTAVRQIETLKSAPLNERLAKVWGTIRATSGERAALLAQYRSQLSEEAVRKGDRSLGRVIYSKNCGNCHKLFDDGRQVGPELTGSQRKNVEYLLENLLDPSAVVGRDYKMTVLSTTDGRVLTGIVKQENDNAVVLLTERDQVTVPKEDIESQKQQNISLMPEGQLQKLTPEEIRNLMAYLTGDTQVDLPKAK
ncbi:MAG: c-type cytochrome [Planctomycetaceae bacterium]|nr:c-type cytochrome [Planctomycetaceae bacterium]